MKSGTNFHKMELTSKYLPQMSSPSPTDDTKPYRKTQSVRWKTEIFSDFLLRAVRKRTKISNVSIEYPISITIIIYSKQLAHSLFFALNQLFRRFLLFSFIKSDEIFFSLSSKIVVTTTKIVFFFHNEQNHERNNF